MFTSSTVITVMNPGLDSMIGAWKDHSSGPTKNCFRFWARNQPNNWKNEDCVHTLGSWGGYTWNDVPCDNCYNFTCFTGNIHETFKEPAGIHAYALNDVALLTDIFPKLLESWVYPIKIGKKTSILFCKRVG